MGKDMMKYEVNIYFSGRDSVWHSFENEEQSILFKSLFIPDFPTKTVLLGKFVINPRLITNLCFVEYGTSILKVSNRVNPNVETIT
jgi:hypothetical protein